MSYVIFEVVKLTVKMFGYKLIEKYVSENIDTEEAKAFLEINYSHVYFIFYDNFVIAETNLRQKGNVKLYFFLLFLN